MVNPFNLIFFRCLIAVAQTVDAGADVIFSNSGPLINETHIPGTATVIALLAGNDQIEYTVSLTLGLLSVIAIAVNGVVNPSTSITAFVVTTGQITGLAILALAAGDVITLRNASGVSIILAPSPQVGAQMTINKLD